ncbi:MAG: dienelactone hydrolase family protein [Chloroflexota bacterium]
MCYDDQARPPAPPGGTGSASGEEIVLTAADGNRFMAYRALPASPPAAQVLILPDIRGLHTFYKELARRFAEVGVAAAAMDYFGRTAGIGSRDEGFEWQPHVQQLTLSGVYADAAATLDDLRAHAGDQPAYTVGFCLGGSLSFLAGAEDLPLAGVVGFYAGMSRSFDGRGTLLDRAGEIRRPALGLFGGADQGIPVEQVEAFDRALDATGVRHEIVIYPGAPHSFFDRRQEEFAEASADAWRRVLAFIGAGS